MHSSPGDRQNLAEANCEIEEIEQPPDTECVWCRLCFSLSVKNTAVRAKFRSPLSISLIQTSKAKGNIQCKRKISARSRCTCFALIDPTLPTFYLFESAVEHFGWMPAKHYRHQISKKCLLRESESKECGRIFSMP